MARSLLPLLAALGCTSKPDPGPGDPGAGAGDSGDPADTAPPGDSGDSGSLEPSVDCGALPALPLAYEVLPGFTSAEDFAFDGAGNYLAFESTTLVSIDIAGNKTALVPVGTPWFSPRGVHMLADGDLAVDDTNNGAVVRIGLDGEQAVLATGLGFPNGITVSADNVIYASGLESGEVYEVDPKTGGSSIIAADIESANGLAFSPDGQTLYVCGFLTGEIWAIDRDEAGGWREPRLVLWMEDALLDGLNVDECGNVYVTEYSAGIVWRIDPEDPKDPQLVAQLPSIWIPNLHWGRGLGGFKDDVLYVADRNTASLVALPVGVRSTPQAFVPGG